MMRQKKRGRPPSEKQSPPAAGKRSKPAELLARGNLEQFDRVGFQHAAPDALGHVEKYEGLIGEGIAQDPHTEPVVHQAARLKIAQRNRIGTSASSPTIGRASCR